MQTDKIAIHVPHQLLSEAVQKYLFSKGYSNPSTLMENCKEIYNSVKKEYVYILLGKSLYLDYAQEPYFENNIGGYTILTVDEFFRWGAEKNREAKISCYGIAVVVDGVIVIKKPEDRGRVLVKITWPEYDEIGKLRPREGE